MTKVSAANAAIVPFKERLLDNGAVERTVKIRGGEYRGHVLRFTKHSEDRYTVYGLSRLPYVCISIERRRPGQKEVPLHDSWARYALRPEHEWVASELVHDCYWGTLGVGATPEDAYRNTFNRFRKGWPA